MRTFHIVLALGAMSPAFADDVAPEPPPAFEEMTHIGKVFHENGNHVRAIDALRGLAKKYADSPQDMQAVAQLLGTHESWLGNETRALEMFAVHVFGNRLPSVHAELPEGGGAVTPLPEVIASIAKDRQLVLINEAHHISRHRVTTRSLLQPLHDEGFRYLAMEALGEKGETLARRGYPVADTGFYLRDPEFGDLVREALRLGFTLVRYEPAGFETQQEREQGQAANVAAILENAPDAKILVHAGYQHIEESGLLGGARTMAQHLREMTGIDPLTLDQATLTWVGDAREPNAVYAAAMRLAADTSEPFVVTANGSAWSLEPERYDVSIITPPTRYMENGRPGWLLQAGERLPVTLDVPGGARLVEARPVNEPDNSVPLDRVEVLSGETVTLLLPRGEYRVTWFDEAGNASDEQNQQVIPPQH